MIGEGSATEPLSLDAMERLLAALPEEFPLTGSRLLVVIPDATRTAPMAALFALINRHLGPRVAQLTYLIALGTHRPLGREAVGQLLGTAAEMAFQPVPGVWVHNHAWNDPASLVEVGQITASEALHLSNGLLSERVPVRVNRLVVEHDVVLLCGPVFPHEVAGFSGGAKYLVPGIAGPEIIDFTHWLGALTTSLMSIGLRDTPVRRVIDSVADLLGARVLALTMAMRGTEIHGLWIGPHREAFAAAAALSADLNINYLPRPVSSVLSAPAPRYEDLWTAAKAMYKTEPVVADGGEIIIYAPHLCEVSHTHGDQIMSVGYHVRDYFLGQWDRFSAVPGTILAHSTHLKGSGTYGADGEQPRIEVTLATGISERLCRRLNLGFRDPSSIDPAEWSCQGAEGRLLVPAAGEVLFRLEADREAPPVAGR